MVWQWQLPAKPPVCHQCQGVSCDLRLGSSGDAALLPWWNAWEHLCGMRRVEGDPCSDPTRETGGTPHTCGECAALQGFVAFFGGISFGFIFILLQTVLYVD